MVTGAGSVSDVAPIRGRGSKHEVRLALGLLELSPPYGGVDRNLFGDENSSVDAKSPPYGGVDRNLGAYPLGGQPDVAPIRGRGSKQARRRAARRGRLSPPYGGVDRNVYQQREETRTHVAPIRGRGSKLQLGTHVDVLAGSPHTGAWIETTASVTAPT